MTKLRLLPISGGHWDRDGVHPGKATSPSKDNIEAVIHKGKLERLSNLTAMFLDYGRKPDYPERTHTCAYREYGNSMQKVPRQGSNPKTFKATVLPTHITHNIYNTSTAYIFRLSNTSLEMLHSIDRNFLLQ